MDTYYNKYIKYKSKYLKLKKEYYGGAPTIAKSDYFRTHLKPSIFEYSRTKTVKNFNDFVKYVLENDSVQVSIKNIVNKYNSILEKYNDVENIINKFVAQIINLVNDDRRDLQKNEVNIDSLLSVFQYLEIIETEHADFFSNILERPHVVFIDGENILNNKSLIFGYFLITRDELILEYLLTDFLTDPYKFFELRQQVENIVFNNLPTRKEKILYVVTTKGHDNKLEMKTLDKYDICKLTIGCYTRNYRMKKECDDLLLLFLHFCHIHSKTTVMSKLWSFDNYNWISRTNIQLFYFKIVFNLNNYIEPLFNFLNTHNTSINYMNHEQFNKAIKEIPDNPLEEIDGSHSFSFVSPTQKIGPFQIFDCVEFKIKDNSDSIIPLSKLLINAVGSSSIYRNQPLIPEIPKEKHYQLLKYIVGLYYNNVLKIKLLCERLVEIGNKDTIMAVDE